VRFKSKIFLISVSVCAIIAALVSYFSQLSFWILFPIVIVAVLINGLIATWEDQRPGGFENPLEKQKGTSSMKRKIFLGLTYSFPTVLFLGSLDHSMISGHEMILTLSVLLVSFLVHKLIINKIVK
jgi:hypothetical protein